MSKLFALFLLGITAVTVHADSLNVSPGSLALGPANNVIAAILCCTNPVSVKGTFTASGLGAVYFNAQSNQVNAEFAGGSPAYSMSVDDSFNRPLITAILNDARLTSAYPNGNGRFGSGIYITYVSPVMLRIFHADDLEPIGSLQFTFSNANLIGTNDLTANIGDSRILLGCVPTPEPGTMMLLGTGLLAAVRLMRRSSKGGRDEFTMDPQA